MSRARKTTTNRPVCGHPIPLKVRDESYPKDTIAFRVFYVHCTKRVGHSKPPFKRQSDKEHKATITCRIEEETL